MIILKASVITLLISMVLIGLGLIASLKIDKDWLSDTIRVLLVMYLLSSMIAVVSGLTLWLS